MKKRSYTLVEILIAMAILVIMMGYLFKFISGANSLWRGSMQRVDDFEAAQTMFTLLEQDFNASTIRSCYNSESDEAAVPWGYTTDSSNTDNLRLMLVGFPAESPDEMALIAYYYVKADAKLYRKIFQNTSDWYDKFMSLNVEFIIENSTEHFGEVNETISADHEDRLKNFIQSLDLSNNREVVAENLTDFSIATTHDADDYFFWNERPEHFRVNATFTNTSFKSGEENVERTFRKTFFTR